MSASFVNAVNRITSSPVLDLLSYIHDIHFNKMAVTMILNGLSSTYSWDKPGKVIIPICGWWLSFDGTYWFITEKLLPPF